jgi:hypothetical protein
MKTKKLPKKTLIIGGVILGVFILWPLIEKIILGWAFIIWVMINFS